MAIANSVRRGIAKLGDTTDDILLACDLTSVASKIGVDGTQIGTPVFSSAGMSPNGAGSVKFSGIDNGNLTWAGQIVCTVTTVDVSQYDNSGVYVTGSVGKPLSAYFDIWALIDSGAAAAGRLIVSSAEQLQAKLDTAEGDQGAYVHSAVHGATCEVCVWWEGSQAGILVDGTPLKTFDRVESIAQPNFTDIVIGADATGAARYFPGTINSVVVSSMAPARSTRNDLRSIMFYGDSYASHSTEPISLPRLSATASTVLRGRMMGAGVDVKPINAGDGGYSVCDTGADDLSGTIDAEAAKGSDVVIFMAGNNDIDASDVQIADGSTGTDANYKSFINSFVAGGTSKIYVVTPGSLYQDSTLNVPLKNGRLTTILAIVRDLPAWWDAANPTNTGVVQLVDLHTLLGGDLVENFNYKGQVDNVGNETIAPGASATAMGDRHLSYQGEIVMGNVFADLILSR